MTDLRQALHSLFKPYLDDELQSLLEESLTGCTDQAAHMDSGVTDVALAGLITAALNQGNLLSPEKFPALVRAENETLVFFKKLFGFHHGHFTSGGSEANIESLWYARQADTGRKRVYGTAACHYSVQKACNMLGLEFQIIKSSKEVMDPAALEQACKNTPPLAVVLNAGTTSAGMLDPLEAATKITHDYAAYCHIDAAWGGFLAFDGQLPPAVQQADSLCFDPHKSLSQPKPCGLLLYQQQPINSGQFNSPYLDAAPAMRLSGASGGERFLGLWLSLRQDSGQAFLQLVRMQINQAQIFSQWLTTQHIACLAGPAAVVCFQLPGQASDRMVESGQFSTTQIDGTEWFRAVFSRPGIQAQALIRAVAAVL